MILLARLLFGIAIVGLASCTVFLILVLVAVIRYRRARGEFQLGPGQPLPPVTLLKPVCGPEPDLERNLETFFVQDYPTYEIVFGARDASDVALQVVEKLRRRHPNVQVKIAYSGVPMRPNAKVCSLEKMVQVAAYDYFIISDSDVRVAPNYIRGVVAPMLNSKVGMVSCMYRGVPSGGLWSRLEALGMSVEMTCGVVVANMLEGMRFALGPTMAIRRDVLALVGGMPVLMDYCADDYLLGNLTHEAGYRVALSDHVVDHVVVNRAFWPSMRHQVRWMKSTRFSRPKGHLGTGLTFAMPFGLLGLIAGAISHNWGLGIILFAYAFANRVVMSIAAGWAVVEDWNSVAYCWLYPLRDLMGFGFWMASYAGRTIDWRGERYRLEFGGKMVRETTAPNEKSQSPSVAVDDLA